MRHANRFHIVGDLFRSALDSFSGCGSSCRLHDKANCDEPSAAYTNALGCARPSVDSESSNTYGYPTLQNLAGNPDVTIFLGTIFLGTVFISFR